MNIFLYIFVIIVTNYKKVRNKSETGGEYDGQTSKK